MVWFDILFLRALFATYTDDEGVLLKAPVGSHTILRLQNATTPDPSVLLHVRDEGHQFIVRLALVGNVQKAVYLLFVGICRFRCAECIRLCLHCATHFNDIFWDFAAIHNEAVVD